MKNVQVIVNPAAGHDQAILNALNRAFAEEEVEWDVAVTKERGDALRLAREAVEKGADVVAGYGGDGTLMEIANGLVAGDVPLGILPGGTGNSLAREWGIPFELEEAAKLICRGGRERQMDLGRIGGRYFMLHAYCGLRRSQRADRELKNSMGIFAYLLQTIRVLRDPREVGYQLTVDGAEVREQGIVCLIINALSVGLDIAFAGEIAPDDGYLDLILVKEATLAMLPELLQDEISEEHMRHWRGKDISVQPAEAQELWVDGEEGGQTPFTALVAPGALRLIVPE